MKTMPAIGEKVRINVDPKINPEVLKYFNNGQDVYVVGTYGKRAIYVNEDANQKTLSIGSHLISLSCIQTMQEIHLSNIFGAV